MRDSAVSHLIFFESRSNPGGLRGPACGLESLAAQARLYASTRPLTDYALAALISAADHLETAAALADADQILSAAEEGALA